LSFIVKNLFTPKEDNQIKVLVSELSFQWTIITEQMNKRTFKQIRERFVNYFDKKLFKKSWNKEKDSRLVELVNQFGPKWNEIKKHFPGRTDVHLKNHFIDLIGNKNLV
jgi:hypothetical protein